MKTFVLLVLFVISVVSGHMCLFDPPMRIVPVGSGPVATNEGPLTVDEFNNAGGNNVAFQKCRRNVNVSPFGNGASQAGFGSVCGGSTTHPDNVADAWNTAGTPTVYNAGDIVTIQFLENIAHPSSMGNRQSFHRIDYSTVPNPTVNGDFIEIAVIPAADSNNVQQSVTWAIPQDSDFTGVLRVVYHSGAENASPFVNLTTTGVSNTYTSCADIQVDNSASAFTISFSVIAMLLFALLQ